MTRKHGAKDGDHSRSSSLLALDDEDIFGDDHDGMMPSTFNITEDIHLIPCVQNYAI